MTGDVLDRKTRAALLLARGMPTDRVGRDVGVTGRTIRRWQIDPQFAEQVAEFRRVSLSETVRTLETVARTAVSVLGRAMTDEDVPTSVRVRAALGVLSTLPTLSAHAELEERLAALEAAADARDEAHR